MTKRQNMGDLFGLDPSKEVDGVLIQYGAHTKVRLARAGGTNDKFAAILEEETRSYRRMMQNEQLPPELDRMITRRVFARAVILGWSEMYDDDAEVPFSTDAAIQMMEKYPEFQFFVQQEAMRLANFRKVSLETEAKN